MNKLIVWIVNIVVAVLCVLSIVGYFFGPFWSVKATVYIQKDQLKEMLSSALGDTADDINYDNIVDERGLPINIEVDIAMDAVLSAFNEEQAVIDIVEGSVDHLVDKITSSISSVSKKVVKEAASSVVKKKVKESVKNFFTEKGKDYTDEEISEKLKSIGITDDFIAEKTNDIIDIIYQGSSTKEEITDDIMNVVEDIFDSISESNNEDFASFNVSEESRQKTRDAVEEIIGALADENGRIDPEELIRKLLLEAINALKGNSAEAHNASVVLTAATYTAAEKSSSDDELKTAVKDYLMSTLEEYSDYLSIALMAMFGLFMLSSLAWLYILIKLLVKLLTKGEPTVKLKAPIILGWLPFLLLVLVPSIAYGVLASVIEEFVGGLAFASVGGVIAFVSAIICFGISIFYMIVRKKNKKQKQEQQQEA